jgi:tetratricopeptide (TPR) repeat protein
MYWRYGLCFLVVVWLGFAICGQLIAVEMRGELKNQLAMYPQKLELLIESAKVSVEDRDVELARKKLFFLSQRVVNDVVTPEEELYYEMLRNDVEVLEQKLAQLTQRRKELGEYMSKYPEHRDLLYLQGINDFNFMNEESAVAKFEQAVDLDPLFQAGWEALRTIKSKN